MSIYSEFSNKDYEFLTDYVTTIYRLKNYVKSQLNTGALEEESDLILDDLKSINRTDFISFESQPYYISEKGYTTYIYRAYLNGLYPRNKVPLLVSLLPPGIVVSETVLDKNGDRKVVHGRNDFTTPLIYGELYPMVGSISSTKKEWLAGYSGNVKTPSREYIGDHWFPFSKKLIDDIVADYSILQIWSEDLHYPLFPLLVEVLNNINNNY